MCKEEFNPEFWVKASLILPEHPASKYENPHIQLIFSEDNKEAIIELAINSAKFLKEALEKLLEIDV